MATVLVVLPVTVTFMVMTTLSGGEDNEEEGEEMSLGVQTIVLMTSLLPLAIKLMKLQTERQQLHEQLCVLVAAASAAGAAVMEEDMLRQVIRGI